MNHIKLLFFATLRDRAGTKSMELDIPAELTVQGLKDKISSEYPTLKASMSSVFITINEIGLNDLLARITLTSTGAAAIFTGMVRGETTRGEAHETEYLEYEAYIAMAEAKMKQVADE